MRVICGVTVVSRIVIYLKAYITKAPRGARRRRRLLPEPGPVQFHSMVKRPSRCEEAAEMMSMIQ